MHAVRASLKIYVYMHYELQSLCACITSYKVYVHALRVTKFMCIRVHLCTYGIWSLFALGQRNDRGLRLWKFQHLYRHCLNQENSDGLVLGHINGHINSFIFVFWWYMNAAVACAYMTACHFYEDSGPR